MCIYSCLAFGVLLQITELSQLMLYNACNEKLYSKIAIFLNYFILKRWKFCLMVFFLESNVGMKKFYSFFWEGGKEMLSESWSNKNFFTLIEKTNNNININIFFFFHWRTCFLFWKSESVGKQNNLSSSENLWRAFHSREIHQQSKWKIVHGLGELFLASKN